VGDVVCRKKDKVIGPYWRDADQPRVYVVLGVGRNCDCEVHEAGLVCSYEEFQRCDLIIII